MKNRLFLFNLILNFSFLLLLAGTGWSRSLKIWLLNFREDFFSLNALYFAFFSALAFCVSFPTDLYEGFILEHRFGLSRQSFGAWFKDVLKKAALTFVVSLIVVEAVYFFLSQFPRSWWLWAALFWFFVSVVLAKISPKFILPLFFRPTPLKAGELRDRISIFLDKHKIKLKEIYVLDFSRKTVKANAMVAGLGKTKQIFLSDTLVSEFPCEEVEVVLAHEVGHYIHKDTFRFLAAGLFFSLLAFFAAGAVFDSLLYRFGFSGPSDISGLPLLLCILTVVSLILLPAQNGYAKRLEKGADRFALESTRDPQAFISLMTRLGKKNFSEFSPSKIIEFFLYDHPPLAQRIKMAQGSDDPVRMS